MKNWKYTEDQTIVILRAIRAGVDLDHLNLIADKSFNAEKMYEILEAIKLEISLDKLKTFCNKNFSDEQILEIRTAYELKASDEILTKITDSKLKPREMFTITCDFFKK